MERERLLELRNAAEDCGGLGQRGPSSPAAPGITAAFVAVERALPAVRTFVRSPAGLWIRDVGDVWKWPHPRDLFAAGMGARQARERPGQGFSMSTKSRGVVERSLSSFVDALQHTFDAEELAKKK